MKTIQFNTENSFGYIQVPDDYQIRGIETNAEVEPMLPAGMQKMTPINEDQLRRLQDDPTLLLPSDLNIRIKPKVAEDNNNDEIQPLYPNL